PPSLQVRFGVRFSPQLQQSSSDILLVNFNGQTISVNLQAQGIGPQFTYSYERGGVTNGLTPGGEIAIADTPVGQTSSVSVTITNAGSGDGQIAALNVAGAGLSLSALPALPVTLRPNGTQRFTLNFAPAQPGLISGTLTIGNNTFTISAAAIGAKLSYTYTNAASVPVDEGGLVIFPPVAV